MAADAHIESVPDLATRNRLRDLYEGKRVMVEYDPNFPRRHPDDPASNPTGRVYRLRPLDDCNLVVNSYGADDSHWELDDGGQSGLASDPGRIMGGTPNENDFPVSVRHTGPWLAGE